MKCCLCKKKIEKSYLTCTIYGKERRVVEVCENCYLRETDRCSVCGFSYVWDTLEEINERLVCDLCLEKQRGGGS